MGMWSTVAAASFLIGEATRSRSVGIATTEFTGNSSVNEQRALAVLLGNWMLLKILVLMYVPRI